MSGGIFDELSEQEEAVLRKGSDFMPESEDEKPDEESAEIPVPPEPISEPGSDEPQDEPQDEPPAEGDDGDFERFKAKHGTKDPEKLLRMAWQQDKARREARHDAKQHAEIVRNLQEGLQKRLAEIRAKQEQEAKAFEERLQTDPDAAVRETFSRQQAEERSAAEQAEWNSYIAKQTEIARQVIPDFDTAAVEMAKFGIEEIGYSPEEAFGVHDARDLKTLYMAMTMNKLVKAGVIDMRGNLLQGQAHDPQTAQQPANPRLAVPPAPRSIGRMGQTGNGRVRTLQEQAQQLLDMPEDEFGAIPEKDMMSMLRALGGGAG